MNKVLDLFIGLYMIFHLAAVLFMILPALPFLLLTAFFKDVPAEVAGYDVELTANVVFVFCLFLIAVGLVCSFILGVGNFIWWGIGAYVINAIYVCVTGILFS